MQKILTSANGLVKFNTTSFLRVTSARLTTLVSLCLATLLLAACGGGGGGGSSSGGGGAQTYQVSSATVVGGFRNVTINWLNPAVGAGNVTAVNITYQIVAVNGPTNDKTTLLLNEPRHLLSDGATVITHTINPFEPARYTFTIEPILGGALINATTRAVVFPNVNVIVNPDDLDGDGVLNAVDVDADGDGLIELRTAAELNMMRYSLDGSGLDDGTTDNDNTTGGNSMGCGGGLYSNNTRITTCNGYEQMADIDLNDLPKGATGSNWEPVGFCIGGNVNTCSANAFAGDFNGNGYIIGNLTINITTSSSGHGFFGSVKDSTLRNVHIHGGNINITRVGNSFPTSLGGLVGYGNKVNIMSSSVVLDTIQTPDISNVGGLTGSVTNGEIRSSVAIIREIESSGISGGLVGGLDELGIVNSSYAATGNSIVASQSGGLISIGGIHLRLTASYALTRSSKSIGYRGLIFILGPITVLTLNSYWDNTILTPSDTASGGDPGRFGVGKTTTELQSPEATNADGSFPAGIYSEWDNGYCNPATGEFRDSSAVGIAGFVRAWNLGGTTDYPTLNCFPRFTPEQQQTAIRRVIVDDVSPISN